MKNTVFKDVQFVSNHFRMKWLILILLCFGTEKRPLEIFILKMFEANRRSRPFQFRTTIIATSIDYNIHR